LWKGALKDTDPIIPENIPENTKITLIGTVETLVEKSMEERPRFVEDMTDEEIWQLQKGGVDNDGSSNDHPIIDIVALQKEHGMNRDDGKMEMYEYNRLVTGLPQRQIDDILLKRLDTTDGGGQQQQQQQQQKQSSSSTELHGELAMTMGLQLRRAYINSLAVLHDGTLISGLDDGHVQLWRRGMMVKDARHNGGCVDEVVVFPSGDSSGSSTTTVVPAFATAGDGTICLWTVDGNCIISLPCFPGTTVASLAVGITNARSSMHHHQYYLAACFRITREIDPNQFRLPPQNEAERRRREAAELREQMIQNQLSDVSRRVKVWIYDESQRNNANGGVVFREELITPHSSNVVETESIAPGVTKIVDMSGNLVCGDVRGIQTFDQNRDIQPSFQRKLALQFQYRCDIDCMQSLHGHLLAVAVSRISDEETLVPADAVGLQIPIARGVYIVDTESASVRAILNGHSDRVKCICPLPDGGILTAGGKFDATTQLWCSDALLKATKTEDEDSEETVILSKPKKLKNPGYVFDLTVLPDKNGSDVYAIAAARYNTINIII
jgi:WD40 repeat protein